MVINDAIRALLFYIAYSYIYLLFETSIFNSRQNHKLINIAIIGIHLIYDYVTPSVLSTIALTKNK